MKLEQTIPYRFFFKWIVLTLCTLLLCSCDDDNKRQSQSPSDQTPDQTGALALKFVYHDTTAGEIQTHTEGGQCNDIGVETIEALIFDAKGKQIAKGGPWDCEKLQGSIDNVAIGTNRTVVSLGRDADKNVIFRGEKTSVQVDAGLKNTTVTVDCYGFVPGLQMFQNGALVKKGTIALAWTAVTGATQYRVQVSENKDMSAPFVVDEVTKEANYFFPEALPITKSHYWRVIAVDVFGHEGHGSEINLVGANSMFKIATGNRHTVAVKSDGTLWSWGDNAYEQLGFDRDMSTVLHPAQVGSDTDWHQVAAGGEHTVAIKTDGTLWGWGSIRLSNYTQDDSSPIQIGNDQDWYQVAASGAHTLALKANGELWGWGYNSNGQLGGEEKGSFQYELSRIEGSDWAYVATGANHTLAIKTNGELWGWGGNQQGQLGLADHEDYIEPVQIGSSKDWSFVSAGWYHSVAVKTSGEIWTWGNRTNNTVGQPGKGSHTGIQEPSQANKKKDWIYAVASLGSIFAINRSGELWAWGDNSWSQLGLGYSSKMAEPEMVGDGSWAFVVSNYIHTAAMKLDGEIWCWGSNSEGQVGNSKIGNKLDPVLVSSDTDWGVLYSSSSSPSHTLITKTNGELWGWGRNIENQLGILEGGGGNQEIPVKVDSDGHWKVLSASELFSAGIKETNDGKDRTLWTWGDNTYGQLGHGVEADEYLNRDVPSQVGTDTLWLDVAVGTFHSVATKTDGTLWSWGANNSGQLGLGDDRENIHASPSRVGTDSDWATVAAGYMHTVAIKTDGTLWSWGDNDHGQLGLGDNGEDTDRFSPAQVGTDRNWAMVSAGSIHTIAIKTDGTLWSWGRDRNGLHGFGNPDIPNRPTQVDSESESVWSSATTGSQYTIAIKADGTLWAWGFPTGSYDYQAGDTPVDYLTNSPFQVGTDSDWANASVIGMHNLSIKRDGTLWSWGWNRDGQLGDGSAWEEVPIQIPLQSPDK